MTMWPYYQLSCQILILKSLIALMSIAKVWIHAASHMHACVCVRAQVCITAPGVRYIQPWLTANAGIIMTSKNGQQALGVAIIFDGLPSARFKLTGATCSLHTGYGQYGPCIDCVDLCTING